MNYVEKRFIAVVLMLMTITMSLVYSDNIEIQVKHGLDDSEPVLRGTISSKGFGKKGSIAVGKFNAPQKIDGKNLMMADFYKVIIDTGASEPLVASIKPCFLASISEKYGVIMDSLTIHVNSAGVPISLSYELPPEATCSNKMSLQGSISFKTSVTIVGPTPSLKIPSEKSYPRLLKPGELPPENPASQNGILAKLKKYWWVIGLILVFVVANNR